MTFNTKKWKWTMLQRLPMRYNQSYIMCAFKSCWRCMLLKLSLFLNKYVSLKAFLIVQNVKNSGNLNVAYAAFKREMFQVVTFQVLLITALIMVIIKKNNHNICPIPISKYNILRNVLTLFKIIKENSNENLFHLNYANKQLKGFDKILWKVIFSAKW